MVDGPGGPETPAPPPGMEGTQSMVDGDAVSMTGGQTNLHYTALTALLPALLLLTT